MSNVFRSLHALAAVAAISTQGTAQDGFVYNFGPSGTPTATPTSTTGSPAAYVTAGAFSIANNFGANATPINATSASSGYTGASGGNNIGVAIPSGVTTINPATTTYFSVTFTPAAGAGGFVLQDFDFGERSTTTGARSLALRSSADGFAADIFTAAVNNNSTY